MILQGCPNCGTQYTHAKYNELTLDHCRECDTELDIKGIVIEDQRELEYWRENKPEVEN